MGKVYVLKIEDSWADFKDFELFRNIPTKFQVERFLEDFGINPSTLNYEEFLDDLSQDLTDCYIDLSVKSVN